MCIFTQAIGEIYPRAGSQWDGWVTSLQTVATTNSVTTIARVSMCCFFFCKSSRPWNFVLHERLEQNGTIFCRSRLESVLRLSDRTWLWSGFWELLQCDIQVWHNLTGRAYVNNQMMPKTDLKAAIMLSLRSNSPKGDVWTNCSITVASSCLAAASSVLFAMMMRYRWNQDWLAPTEIILRSGKVLTHTLQHIHFTSLTSIIKRQSEFRKLQVNKCALVTLFGDHVEIIALPIKTKHLSQWSDIQLELRSSVGVTVYLYSRRCITSVFIN